MRRIGRWTAGMAFMAALCASPALAGWPAATPAQPLVQGPMRCALGIAPLNRRCKVVDFAEIGEIEGRDWYYAFYATHWADRHGRQTRAFPIIFYLQKPATLRLGLWINDEPGLAGRWALIAPPRPVLIHRPDGAYLGFSLKAIRGQDDQRLFRLEKLHWTGISSLYRTDPETARIAAATPKDCTVDGDGVYDWTSFTLRMSLKQDRSGAPCGTLVGALDVQKNKVVVTRATLEPLGLPTLKTPTTPSAPPTAAAP